MRIRQPRKPQVEPTRGWEALTKLLEKRTQIELAEETGVSQSVISALLSLQGFPSRKTLKRLEGVGIKASWWNEKGRKAA